MGENSKISWTDHTFSPWIGCSKVSGGCANCYAERADNHYSPAVPHWGKGVPRRRTSGAYWRKPDRWNKKAAAAGSPALVFCSSQSDWLDDEIPIFWLADLLHLIDKNRNLVWILLSKRPEFWEMRLRHCLAEALAGGDLGPRHMIREWLAGRPPAHVWIGTTAEDQENANKRIPSLLRIPAAIRFLSCEPLLGEIVFEPYWMGGYESCKGDHPQQIQWIIAGGETGPKARPAPLVAARGLRDQALLFGAAFLFKQWGEWLGGFQDGSPEATAQLHNLGGESVRVGSKVAGHLLDCEEWQQFPKPAACTLITKPSP